MILTAKKIYKRLLWLSFWVSPPLAALSAEHLLSLNSGLNQPADTAISQQGDIYVLNGPSGEVKVFSPEGRQKFSFGNTGKQHSRLNHPMGIRIYQQQVFIADTGGHRIAVFDQWGRLMDTIELQSALPENAPVEPVALLIRDNNIIWSDRKNHQLCITQINTKKTLNCWGGKGESDGKFMYPYQLAVDEQNYIYAVDTLNARVQAFNSRGRHFMNTGRFGANTGGALFRPNGLALTETGELLVSDAYTGRISVFKNGRPLGLLADKQGHDLLFKSATSLSLHKNKLYVVDTLNNSIEIFKLIKSEEENQAQKNLPINSASSSRKNCMMCHISWTDNYQAGKKSIEFLAPVAQKNMCYSCHHGVVIDSRERIGQLHQHPDIQHPVEDDKYKEKNKRKNGDKIAPSLPSLDKKNRNSKSLYCGSCHTPHMPAGDGDSTGNLKGLHNNSWMRDTGNNQELCQQCHQSKIDLVQQKKRPAMNINHPIGIYLKPPLLDKNKKYYPRDKSLQQGLPQTLANGKARLNDKQQMICRSCHRAHGTKEENLTVVKTAEAYLCQQCHRRHSAKDLKDARKKGVHPVNIKLDQPVKINNKEITHVDCLSCHSSHNGKAGSALLVMENKDGELCNVCHQDYSRIVNTDHDLRLSAPDSKNRHDKKAKDIYVCGSCHAMHEAEANNYLLDATKKNIYQGNEKPLDRDRICLSCHYKNGSAEKSQIKHFSHPDKNIILRSGKKSMPLLDQKNKISEFGKIGCISCHNPHRWSVNKPMGEALNNKDEQVKNKNGNIRNSFLRNESIQKLFCKDCHGPETRLKYKYYHLEISRPSHK